MVFNSIEFIIFFLSIYIIYWSIYSKYKVQNVLLLVGSYFFYAWWDWRFLGLLVGSSIFTFISGKIISSLSSELKKKIALYIGVSVLIGILSLFKYFSFFALPLSKALFKLGFNTSLHTMKVLLPLGLSFYSFRLISYLIDIYKNKIEPTKGIIPFLSYVSFFPSLISGPIDRASSLIPQFERERKFDYALSVDGFKQILWGLFKKIVIADSCAIYTNQLFGNYTSYSGTTLILAAFLYTIQIYADFSGYSDMAIGIGKLLGFKITKNFDFPLFSQNIAEFWRKWHISLTSWLTEYLFTPLSIAFRDFGKFGLILAILINFTIIGAWHGASWTFVLFGFVHGCYFIPLIIKGTMNKKLKLAKDRTLPTFRELFNIMMTFSLVMLTFIIFRCSKLVDVFNYFKKIGSGLISINSYGDTMKYGYSKIGFTLPIFILVMIIIEWVGRNWEYGIAKLYFEGSVKKRWAFYYFLIFIIISCLIFSRQEKEFIYFQF